MIWVRLAGEAVTWSSWLWRHRAEFEPVLRGLGDAGDFAQAAIASPDNAVRRVGNTLIFGQPEGGERVLAFIEQSGPRMEHIEQAVGGLVNGQGALSTSLDSLRTLSMVTLGLSALTPVVLVAQFVALNRRLHALQNQISHLHQKFDAAVIADLKAGLDLLHQGEDLLDSADRANAHSRLTAALPYCIRTMKYFSELLGAELNRGRINREEVRLLARHLSVAVAGVASCQIGLEQDRHAFGQSATEIDLLKRAARWVFHETVAKDPAPYMLPALKWQGVTIEFMAQLYRQAQDAGAIDRGTDCSVPAWFEGHREAIFHARKPWKGWDERALLGRLHEAVAAVEETNRVVGLSRLVEHVRESAQNTLAVMKNLKQATSSDDAEAGRFLAWGLN